MNQITVSKRIFARATALILMMAMCFWFMPFGMITIRAEGGTYITSISLMQGDLSEEKLSESGYSVMSQPLNSTKMTSLYLGYQTGGESDAIRDLLVSSSGSESIEKNGIDYQKVSDISLNEGAGGPALYLYATRDAAAGEALKGLSFLVKKSPYGAVRDEQVLASDGSEVVTTDDGKTADFDEGIADSEIYLRMYKGELYRPYVDNVIVATGDSEEAVISKLAAERCTYYVNMDIGDEKPVYVGYTRTDDETKALRGLVAIGTDESGSGQTDEKIHIKDITYKAVKGGDIHSDNDYIFYMTKDEDAGSPIYDLVACGYDPEEMGLTEQEETATDEEDAGETDTGEPKEPDGGSDDDTEIPSVSVSGSTVKLTQGEPEGGQSDDGDVPEEKEPEKDDQGSESDVEKTGFADAIRVYSDITMKDWISGYFVRGGGQSASKYLYEESAYVSASESDEKLWISNIYCSSKKRTQFVNYIGYVSEPGMSEKSPFKKAVSYDSGDASQEADSTASVFDGNISALAIAVMVCAVLIAVIGSLGYKMKKNDEHKK